MSGRNFGVPRHECHQLRAVKPQVAAPNRCHIRVGTPHTSRASELAFATNSAAIVALPITNSFVVSICVFMSSCRNQGRDSLAAFDFRNLEAAFNLVLLDAAPSTVAQRFPGRRLSLLLAPRDTCGQKLRHSSCVLRQIPACCEANCAFRCPPPVTARPSGNDQEIPPSFLGDFKH